MKRLLLLLLIIQPCVAMAQGWPAQYQGVMLQGFYWDSFADSRWKVLESEANTFKDYFSLVWVPQSGNCGGNQSMGYDPMYWFDQNSTFGTEAELRSMIRTFNSKGIGTIADVVINHRKNLSNWVDFPTETYRGTTYTMGAADICANDDNGATKTWAAKNSYTLSAYNDTGEDWGGMRDLDHNSANVQRCVGAYLDFLQADMGYAGFRYDMVKGYAARFTGMYNATAQAQFSVGEYWDSNVNTVKNWINGTKVGGTIQSAAFDFPFRYTVRDAINNNDWSKLANTSTLAANADYQRYSVTFVENHDTEYRSSTSQQDPIRRDTLAANAFMLAMPGTPCVFFKHWMDCRHDIAKMIFLRNLAGIHNQSRVSAVHSSKDVHAHMVQGKNFDIVCVVGKDAWSYEPPNIHDWHLMAAGYHWAYWTSEPVSMPDITFPEEQFEPYEITVGVDVDNVGWSSVNFWTWGGDGTHAPANSKWPGDPVTTKQTLYGSTYYTRTYTISSARDCVSFVFSTGTGSPQTVDIPNITESRYYRISKTQQSGKYTVDDVTPLATGIADAPGTAPDSRTQSIYTLDGRKVSRPSRGLYIIDGKARVLR